MAPDATKVHLSDRGFPEPVVAVARRLRGASLSGSDPVPEHSNACGGIVLGSVLIAAYSARLKAWLRTPAWRPASPRIQGD